MSKKVYIGTTSVFDRNLEATTRFVVNQGGARSSKTFSILQRLIALALQNPKKGLTIDIVRKTGTALRNSAYKDFLEIITKAGFYNQDDHNRMSSTYELCGNTFSFFGVDSSQKVRGRKRDYLYVNEANEITGEDFKQLRLRTKHQIFIDYNPSDMSSWIYDLLEYRPESTTFIKSTFMDNDFLDQTIRDEILSLQFTDPEGWQIFGLGEKAESQYLIFPRWEKWSQEEPKHDDWCYGLDTGYTHPTALVKCWLNEGEIYWKEEIYKTKLTISDLVTEMDHLEIDKSAKIFCDSADPKTIEELKRNGYNAMKSDKSVKAGIDSIKSHRLFVHEDSLHLHKELRDYRWMRNGEQLTDKPVKFQDDGLDAARYGSYNLILQHRKGPGRFFVSTVNW